MIAKYLDKVNLGREKLIFTKTGIQGNPSDIKGNRQEYRGVSVNSWLLAFFDGESYRGPYFVFNLDINKLGDEDYIVTVSFQISSG